MAPPDSRPLSLLVLGGTRFVGRHLVDAAVARGHAVTLFNRGQSDDSLFPDLEHLHGDRDGGLGVLEGRTWDAVVDTCGYVPRIVGQSVDALKGAVGRYLFVSTISVYDEPMVAGAGEDAPLKTLDDPGVETVTPETYGGLKVLCEQRVTGAFGDRATVVRPGMIVGPHDPTDRYTWWAVRVRQGGEVLVPGTAERPVQFIDARDLGAFMVALLEQDTPGVFNATGPGAPLAWGAWMSGLREAAGADATLRWVDDAFLEAQGVTGAELPFWVPPPDEQIFGVSIQRAVEQGLTFRPALETARDTLAWRADASVADLAVGLDPAREAKLLAQAPAPK